MLPNFIKLMAATVVVLFVLGIAALYVFQSRLIYFPRSYKNDHYQSLLETVDRIEYNSNERSMVAFAFPATETAAPEKIWWLFGGNGSLALDWLPLLEEKKIPKGIRYILVDYPGYGLSDGKPKPDAIFDAVDHLGEQLAAEWQLSLEEVYHRSSVMGHSLGSAIALHTAAKYHIKTVVAVSPFTSMADMAGRQMGWLKFLLKHDYDNRESVRLLFSENSVSHLTLFHGERDTLIPISMSHELKTLVPSDAVTFRSVPNAGHGDIVSKWSRGALAEILTQP